MKLEELTDRELKILYWEAQEMRIGYKIKQIKDEMNRRSKEL